MHTRNSSNVTLIVIDLKSKIILDAKKSSLCYTIAVLSNKGLLILKANPILDLGGSCYLCYYIFQIFFHSRKPCPAICYPAKAQNKASNIRFKWDSHVRTAAHLKDSSSKKALGMTGC